MSFIGQIKHLEADQEDIFLIHTELFINALDHGVLGLSSQVKLAPDGMTQYLAERADRLQKLEAGQIEVELAGYWINGQIMLKVRVADSGPGFDVTKLTESGWSASAGRGIRLVRALCVSLQFSGNGNHVEAWYLSPRASTRAIEVAAVAQNRAVLATMNMPH